MIVKFKVSSHVKRWGSVLGSFPSGDLHELELFRSEDVGLLQAALAAGQLSELSFDNGEEFGVESQEDSEAKLVEAMRVDPETGISPWQEGNLAQKRLEEDDGA